MSKRGWFILGVMALLGIVAVYGFLEKEHEKRVNAAKEEQGRCEARNARFKINATQRELIAPPPIPDLWARTWTDAFGRVREGQSEADVEGILGLPGYTRCNVNQAGDNFEGSVWQYRMWMAPNMPNGNNTIQIEFGPYGRVQDKSMMKVVYLDKKPVPPPSTTATPVKK